MPEDEGTPQLPYDLLEQQRTPDMDAIGSKLTGESFRAWRRREKYCENLANNNPQYNTGGYDTEPFRHSPHTVGQCMRKQWYRERNAIEETASPDGIFTIGTWIEELLIEPWVEALADAHGAYCANSLWLESCVETEVGEITIAGSSDPAIVDSEGVPLAITEVKSKSSLSNLAGPARRHKAQLHCYLYGARDHYDLSEYPTGYLIYVGKKRFDVEVFRVDFDQVFFEEEVLDWCARMSWSREEGLMPAADPFESWECKLCAYRGRCGNYDDGLPWEDISADGLLPLFDYPRESVIQYMYAHPEGTLTPTVAVCNPDLAQAYAVADWQCSRCSESFVWDEFNKWTGDVDDPPFCPRCADDGYCIDLRGDLPA